MGMVESLRGIVGITAAGVTLAVGCATATLPDGNDDGECSIGAEGCECTPGGGCDKGLLCLSEFCVDPGGSASSGGGGAPTTGSSTAAAGTTNVTSGPSTTASTTVGSTSAATTSVGSTSAATTSSTGSGTCSLPNPTMVDGCSTSCGTCDPWISTWAPVAGATHYKVKFLCGIGAHLSPNILDTDAELCDEVGMCSYCANGLAGMWIQACDGTCCSSGTPVPEAEAPIACGGGCCL